MQQLLAQLARGQLEYLLSLFLVLDSGTRLALNQKPPEPSIIGTVSLVLLSPRVGLIVVYVDDVGVTGL